MEISTGANFAVPTNIRTHNVLQCESVLGAENMNTYHILQNAGVPEGNGKQRKGSWKEARKATRKTESNADRTNERNEGSTKETANTGRQACTQVDRRFAILSYEVQRNLKST